jgi:ParB family chromosome partitioning protein
MAKSPPKFSGLVRAGAFVPATGESNLPDFPAAVTPQSPSPLPASQDESRTAGRDIREIDVELIDPNPLAPREVYTAEMILTRADELMAQGQHDPIHVIPNPGVPGRYIICDGWTRVQACRMHHVLDKLLAEIHQNLTLEQSAWFGYEQNEGRSQHTDLDRAMFFAKLLAAGETQVEIARRTKISPQLMSILMSYRRLPVNVLDVVRTQPQKFSSNAAYHLARLNESVGSERTLALALQFAHENRSIRWLTNQVRLCISPAVAIKPTVTAKTIRYTHGVFTQRGDHFDLSISVPQEHRDEFAAELEALLSKVALEAEVSDTAPVDHQM